MANSIFNAMKQNNKSNNFLDAFPDFMQQMKGKNPYEMINGLISSGKINQQQLDVVQQQAQQMSGMFEKLRGMFK